MIYFLSIGSNLGNREATIRRSIEMLNEQVGMVDKVSSFYYTAPWGFKSYNMFVNVALSLTSAMQPHDLLLATQNIERALGRTHKTVNNDYQDRTIDIDLLQCFADDGKEITISLPDLTLPHPHMQEREFVTIPLKEIR